MGCAWHGWCNYPNNAHNAKSRDGEENARVLTHPRRKTPHGAHKRRELPTHLRVSFLSLEKSPLPFSCESRNITNSSTPQAAGTLATTAAT